eukprot:266438-Amorphochlora_amoeboformis.AAC.2
MASGAHEPMEEEGQVDNGNKEVPKENEDPVVCEIPVKFSKKLIEKLFLLQYPMRPRQRPYSSDLRRLNARIKPLQRKGVEHPYKSVQGLSGCGIIYSVQIHPFHFILLQSKY